MSDTNNLMAVQAALSEEPFLTMPVSEYHPKVLRADLEVGVAPAFKEFYKANLQDQPGRISFYGRGIAVTPRALAALRAVLYAGCCRCPSRAEACREVFLRACESAGDQLDEAGVVETFIEYSANPFVSELQKAVAEVLA